MEEQEHEEQKPIENWNGEERRQGGQGNYEGDERRKASAIPTGDLTGRHAGMSEKHADKEDND